MPKYHRTRPQREADALDMDVFHMIDRLEKFASDHGLRGGNLDRVDAAASALRSARLPIRDFMHPEDVEMTRDS